MAERYGDVHVWKDPGEGLADVHLAVWDYALGGYFTLEPDGTVKHLAGLKVDRVCYAPTSGMLRARLKPQGDDS